MTGNYNCVILDDDKTFIQVLENYISQVPKLHLLGSFSNPKEDVNKIVKLPAIDFLFLDIKMEISGIIVGQILRDKVRFLIFISAHKNFALEAFSVNCDHFLLKPISFDQFLTSINKVISRNLLNDLKR